MTVPSIFLPFIELRQQFIQATHDPVLCRHFQAEIDLVRSWGTVGGGYVERRPDPVPAPLALYENGPPPIRTVDFTGSGNGPGPGPVKLVAKTTTSTTTTTTTSGDYGAVPHGYAADWHTIRFSNTTGEAITVHVTVASGQPLPKGVDANGDVTIRPGQYVDLTFAPGSSANFRSTKGDGSVWNQGEVYFDETNHVIWGDMSYIYGANSNMRIFSQDGQHSGYLGDLFAKAPPAARVGDWGIVAPYDRFHPSDDPNNPDSATGGPGGAKNAGADFFYSVLNKGEGYVDRGRPAEVVDYDDASSLRFTGNVAVVL